MKLTSAFTYAVSALSLTSTIAAKHSSSLRGQEQDVDGPFSVFKCTIAGKEDKDICSTTVNNDNQPCDYCTISNDGQDAGLCVDPQIAEQMKQLNPDCTCTNTESISNYDAEAAIDVDVDGPFAKLKCTIEAKGDADTCATAVTDDGEPCDYCTISSNGQDAGLCVNPDVAEQMEQLNPDCTCTNTESTSVDVKKSEASSLRGREQDIDVDGPFAKLKCTIEAKGDADTCATAVTDDGEPCDYCTISSDGQEAGLCVNPEVAEQMKQLNPDCTCTNTESTSVSFDKADFKCTIEAVNDAEKCASTKTNGDQDWCEYCTMDGPFGTQGICVSPEHADGLNTLVGNKVSCISHDKFTIDASLSSSPITDCNFDGADRGTCLDPSKVNGSRCVWCDAGIGGFCFPESWKEKAGRFFSCEEPSELVDEINPEDDVSFFNSSCFKEGLTGASPDDCRAAVDDDSGENCVFCNAPTIGGIGVCMPPTYKGKEGRFYNCDINTILSVQ
jgi:hypothetical protein